MQAPSAPLYACPVDITLINEPPERLADYATIPQEGFSDAQFSENLLIMICGSGVSLEFGPSPVAILKGFEKQIVTSGYEVLMLPVQDDSEVGYFFLVKLRPSSGG